MTTFTSMLVLTLFVVGVVAQTTQVPTVDLPATNQRAALPETGKPTTLKVELPTTQKVQLPTTQKVELLPTTQKVQLPTTQKVQLPTTQKVQLPTTQKVELPTTQKVQLPTTQKTRGKPITTEAAVDGPVTTAEQKPTSISNPASAESTTQPPVEATTRARPMPMKAQDIPLSRRCECFYQISQESSNYRELINVKSIYPEFDATRRSSFFQSIYLCSFACYTRVRREKLNLMTTQTSATRTEKPETLGDRLCVDFRQQFTAANPAQLMLVARMPDTEKFESPRRLESRFCCDTGVYSQCKVMSSNSSKDIIG